MSKPLKQPERGPLDGPIAVRRIGESIIIEAKQGALESRVEMSEFNAWRAFGCLALILEIPLPKSVMKAIQLGGPDGAPPKAAVGFPEPKTLGERLAQNLIMQEAERRGLVEKDTDQPKPSEEVGDG